MTMMRVTEDAFDTMLPADWPRGHPLLHDEVGWLADDRYLGIIVRDKVDRDYGYVLLRRNPSGDSPEFVWLGSSFATVEQACTELEARRRVER